MRRPVLQGAKSVRAGRREMGGGKRRNSGQGEALKLGRDGYDARCVVHDRARDVKFRVAPAARVLEREWRTRCGAGPGRKNLNRYGPRKLAGPALPTSHF